MRTKRFQRNGSINGSEPQARSVSRRSFLGTTLAGGAALYAGGLDSLTNSESLESPDSVNFLEKTIPGAQRVTFPGVGHNAPDLQAPKAVAAELAKFFAAA